MGSHTLYGSRKASLTLDVIVVGCGISGLCTAFCLTQAGHRVTIIESSSMVGPEVGAGVLLGPNSSRLLRRWGLGKRLDEVAIRPEGVAMRKYSNGERLSFNQWGATAERRFGAPYYQIHRADLHKSLYDLAAPHVTVILGSPVVGCDPNPVAPSVTLKSGRVLKADLIVGADGLKSYIQEVVLGEPNRADPTGDAAYRALIPTSLMMQDPGMRELIEPPQLTTWMAPRRHLVGYPIVSLFFFRKSRLGRADRWDSFQRKETYNLVFMVPDDGSVESWGTEGDIDEMKRDVEDFEPR